MRSRTFTIELTASELEILGILLFDVDPSEWDEDYRAFHSILSLKDKVKRKLLETLVERGMI